MGRGGREFQTEEIASAKPLWQEGIYLKNLKRGVQTARAELFRSQTTEGVVGLVRDCVYITTAV